MARWGARWAVVGYEVGRRLSGHAGWRRRDGARRPAGPDAGRRVRARASSCRPTARSARVSVGDYERRSPSRRRSGSARRRVGAGRRRRAQPCELRRLVRRRADPARPHGSRPTPSWSADRAAGWRAATRWARWSTSCCIRRPCRSRWRRAAPVIRTIDTGPRGDLRDRRAAGRGSVAGAQRFGSARRQVRRCGWCRWWRSTRCSARFAATTTPSASAR